MNDFLKKSPDEMEAIFVSTFIKKVWRDRIRHEFKSKSKRHKVLSRIDFNLLDVCQVKLVDKFNNFELIKASIEKYAVGDRCFCMDWNYTRSWMDNSECALFISTYGPRICLPCNEIMFFKHEMQPKLDSFTYIYKALILQ